MEAASGEESEGLVGVGLADGKDILAEQEAGAEMHPAKEDEL